MFEIVWVFGRQKIATVRDRIEIHGVQVGNRHGISISGKPVDGCGGHGGIEAFGLRMGMDNQNVHRYTFLIAVPLRERFLAQQQTE